MSGMKEKWKSTPKWVKIICYVFLGIAAVIAFGFVFGFLIELLWNWLMPELFGLKKITYWQGIGIFVLARVIFGSFGGNSSSSKPEKDKTKKKDSLNSNEETEEKYKNTGNYDAWWETEGKKAFDDYVEKKYNPEKSNET